MCCSDRVCGKRLTISKSVFQAVNRSWTDNTIAQRKMINYDLQRKIIITQKTKQISTRIPLRSGIELRKINSSRLISGIRRFTLTTNPMISNE
jgi:hypothetical protein